MADKRILFLGGLLFLIIADAGLISEADGFAFSVCYLLCFPSCAPYFLVLIAGVQDVRGLSYYWWYPSFAFASAVTYISFLIEVKANRKTLSWDRTYFRLAFFSALVIVYGVASSYANDLLGGVEQAASRSPMIVGGLMFVMLFSAMTTIKFLDNDSSSRSNFLIVIFLTLLNGMFVLGSQLVLGPETLNSRSGRFLLSNTTDGAEQLLETTSLGFARMTGSYLTPNGFGLCMAYLMLLAIILARPERIRSLAAWGYFLLGLLFSVLSLSKATAIYFIISSLAVFLLVYGRMKVAIAFSIILLIASAFFLSDGGTALLEAFRVPTNADEWGDSYRSLAWSLVLQKFSLSDWLFGIGLAHWPIFFNENLGFPLSDPHNWLFSIPGNYGFLGILFYVILIYFLLRILLRGTRQEKIGAVSLLIMFLVHDLGEIPYVMGNTPLTFLIWVSIGLICPGGKNNVSRVQET